MGKYPRVGGYGLKIRSESSLFILGHRDNLVDAQQAQKLFFIPSVKLNE